VTVAPAVEGWLTEAQAQLLHDRACAPRPAGAVVEIGSFRGRSTIVLARAAGSVVAIDPHAGSDRGPREIAARPGVGERELLAFRGNLERAGVADRVRHVRDFSSLALRAFDGPVDLLFVDGAHRFGPARADLVRWGARVPAGGRMLVHDAYSSVGVTLALLTSVVPARSWRYLGRDGSLAAYVRARSLAPGRELAALGWFAGNLVRKGLIVARLREGPWPH
jgi:hypothetical protein